VKKSPYKQIREYLGLGQEDIADILDMTQPGWSAVERGRVGLPDEKKRVLHNEYGISYKYMIEGKGDILEGKKSSRKLNIEINGKKTTIKESEFKEIKISAF